MNDYTNKSIKIEEIGVVHYESSRHFQKRYPKEIGGYKVVGAIGEIKGNRIGKWIYNDADYDYYEISYKKLSHGIIGYIEIGHHEYIAIVKNRILYRVSALILSILIIGAMLSGIYFGLMNHNIGVDSGIEKYENKIKSPDVKKNTILIPGYGNILIKDNSDTAYISLWNPDKNTCYFRFKIILDNKQETIYESKLIPPGYAVTKVEFNQSFKQGEYPVTIQIECYDGKDQEIQLNGGEVKTRIVAVKKEN